MNNKCNRRPVEQAMLDEANRYFRKNKIKESDENFVVVSDWLLKNGIYGGYGYYREPKPDELGYGHPDYIKRDNENYEFVQLY